MSATPTAGQRIDVRLNNGLRFVGERIERSQGVAIALRLPAGIKDDPAAQPGLAHLVKETLFKGTKKRDARALSDAFDFLGIRHSSHVGMESTSVSMRFLPEHLSDALGLLREVLSEPAFPEDECETAKVQAVQEIKHLDDEPLSKVFVILKEMYFGQQWGHFEMGTEALLPAIARADIETFWKQRYIPQGTIVSAAGKFDPDALAWELETLLANSGTAPVPSSPPPPPPGTVRQHVQKDSKQTQIALAFPGVARKDKDYYAAQAAVGVLSGGMSGRLFTEVREKRGLVYSVGAQTVSLRNTGAIYVYGGTTPEKAGETLKVLKTELTRLGNDATQEEVDRAKVGFKAHILMDQESTGARAREMLDDVYFEDRIVPVSEIVQKVNAVTADDVKRYWSAHPFEPFALVTLGKEALE